MGNGLMVLSNVQLQASIAAVRRIATYELSADQRESFLYFHTFVTSPVPKYISAWRSGPEQEHWYHQHVGGILGDAQAALAASYYHASHLKELELAVTNALAPVNFQASIPPGSVIGFGGTNKLDFEYHAVIFAGRRALDYMTRGIAAYFKQKFHSFRDLPRTLVRFKKDPVAAAILEAYARVQPKMDFLLSDGSNKSIRDLITHHHHVQVGSLNLTNRGLFFAGGGESLNMDPSSTVKFQIYDAVNARLADLHEAIAGVLHAFVDAARQADQPT